MVALNEKFSHSGVPASEGRVSPDEIDAFDFTKRSEEVRGGSVANFGGAGFRGLSDTSPLRRRSAAPVHRYDPESELHYVRNRTYSPALGRRVQRDPIGYQGAINLYEYVRSKLVADVDSEGTQAYGVRPYVQPSTGGGGEFLVGWGDAIIEGGGYGAASGAAAAAIATGPEDLPGMCVGGLAVGAAGAFAGLVGYPFVHFMEWGWGKIAK